MENHILVGKRIELEKLKEYSLRIPVNIDPTNSIIEINLSNEQDILPLKLELVFANSARSHSDRNLIVPFELNQKITNINLRKLDVFGETGNYLLLGLKSDKRASIELSIISIN